MATFPQNLTLTATATSGIAAPNALTGLGYSVVFFDDFTTNQIYPGLLNSTTFQSGYNWYWDQCINSTSDYQVVAPPTIGGTASTIPTTITINGSTITQGNNGGGQNASLNGGILTFLQQPGPNLTTPYNGCICTIPYNSSNSAPFTTNGQGVWSHGYFEAYIQYNPFIESVVPTGATLGNNGGFAPWGWPAWWSTASTFGSNQHCEIDFMEFYGIETFGGLPGPFTVTGTVTSGSPTITAVSSTSAISAQYYVSGTGIPSQPGGYGAIITGKGTNTLTLSTNATGNATGTTLTITPRQSIINTSILDWTGSTITHGTPSIIPQAVMDANWHTYGMLWTSTGTGTGHVSFYLDNNPAYYSTPTGTGATYGQFLEDNPFLQLRLGCGNGWPMNVDWIRVWQL